MHIHTDACPYNCDGRKVSFVMPDTMEFKSVGNGDIEAFKNGALMGTWSHDTSIGTFKLEVGGTAFVRNLTTWLKLMHDGKRI